jgi:5'-3' exonuclease
MKRFQADDVIASAAHRFGDAADVTYICSSDQDFCQCVRGDVSDGIPGFGAKKAARLLQEYGDLDQVIAQAPAWAPTMRGGTTLAATLTERSREAELYRNLSIRRSDVPLPHELKDLEWRNIDVPRLAASIADVEEDAVIPRLNRWDRIGQSMTVYYP